MTNKIKTPNRGVSMGGRLNDKQTNGVSKPKRIKRNREAYKKLNKTVWSLFIRAYEKKFMDKLEKMEIELL